MPIIENQKGRFHKTETGLACLPCQNSPDRVKPAFENHLPNPRSSELLGRSRLAIEGAPWLDGAGAAWIEGATLGADA